MVFNVEMSSEGQEQISSSEDDFGVNDSYFNFNKFKYRKVNIEDIEQPYEDIETGRSYLDSEDIYSSRRLLKDFETKIAGKEI